MGSDSFAGTTPIKEQKKEIKELYDKLEERSKALEKYDAFEETVKKNNEKNDQLINDKNATIASLNDDIKKLKEENKTVEVLKKQITLLQLQIEEVQEESKNKEFDFQTQLQQKDMARQRQLLNLREELQDKFETRMEKIYDTENAKRDIDSR